MDKLKGLDILVVNALRKKKHISHYNLEEAVGIAAELKPKRAYFTHISHLLGLHEAVEGELPPNVFLASDGLVVEAGFGWLFFDDFVPQGVVTPLVLPVTLGLKPASKVYLTGGGRCNHGLAEQRSQQRSSYQKETSFEKQGSLTRWEGMNPASGVG